MDSEILEKAADLVFQLRKAGSGLTHAQQELRNAQEAITFYTPVAAQFENECRELNAQLKALGFHDAGHARGVIAKERHNEQPS